MILMVEIDVLGERKLSYSLSNLLKEKEFIKRLLSSLIIFFIAIPPLVLGGNYWVLFVYFVGIVMYVEWTKLLLSKQKEKTHIIILLLQFLFILCFAIISSKLLFLIIIGLFIYSYVFKKEIGYFPLHTLGCLIVIMGCSWAIITRLEEHGLENIIWLGAIVIGTDVGAYFIGKLVGKRKILPKISPNKTWEGAIGGVFLAILLSVFVLFYFKAENYLMGICLALPLSIISQVSDFLQSSVKRHFGVKDMGNIIPGHGGVFDRLDGFIASIIIYGMILASTSTSLIWQ